MLRSSLSHSPLSTMSISCWPARVSVASSRSRSGTLEHEHREPVDGRPCAQLGAGTALRRQEAGRHQLVEGDAEQLERGAAARSRLGGAEGLLEIRRDRVCGAEQSGLVAREAQVADADGAEVRVRGLGRDRPRAPRPTRPRSRRPTRRTRRRSPRRRAHRGRRSAGRRRWGTPRCAASPRAAPPHPDRPRGPCRCRRRGAPVGGHRDDRWCAVRCSRVPPPGGRPPTGVALWTVYT